MKNSDKTCKVNFKRRRSSKLPNKFSQKKNDIFKEYARILGNYEE